MGIKALNEILPEWKPLTREHCVMQHGITFHDIDNGSIWSVRSSIVQCNKGYTF